jgi:hypothetical protein
VSLVINKSEDRNSPVPGVEYVPTITPTYMSNYSVTIASNIDDPHITPTTIPSVETVFTIYTNTSKNNIQIRKVTTFAQIRDAFAQHFAKSAKED